MVGVDITDTGDMVSDADPFVGTGVIKAGISAGIHADAWRIRGKYYRDYYKNTGKRPRYYSRLTRRKYKW